MRRAGLLSARPCRPASRRDPPRRHHAGARRSGRGLHPVVQRCPTSSSSPATRIPSARASTRRSSTASRPTAACCSQATCSRSTAAPSSRAGTATSRSSSAVRDAGRPEDLRLIDVTEEALWAGISALTVGGRLCADRRGRRGEHRVRVGGRRARVRDHRGVRRARDRQVEDPQIPTTPASTAVIRRSVQVHRGHRADGHAGQQRHPRPRRRLDGRHERRVTGGTGSTRSR